MEGDMGRQHLIQKVPKHNCTEKPLRTGFSNEHLQVGCNERSGFKLHSGVKTCWHRCQHRRFCCCSRGCSPQTCFGPESAFILKWGCPDICGNGEHHLTCARLGLNGTALRVRPTVIYNLENAHMWQASLIALWRAGRTSRWFFIAW